MELDDVEAVRGPIPDAAQPPKKKKPLATVPKMPLVTAKGLKPLPEGRNKYRVLGRLPSKILKAKRYVGAVKALNLKHRIRRRNVGDHLDYDEAKDRLQVVLQVVLNLKVIWCGFK